MPPRTPKIAQYSPHLEAYISRNRSGPKRRLPGNSQKSGLEGERAVVWSGARVSLSPPNTHSRVSLILNPKHPLLDFPSRDDNEGLAPRRFPSPSRSLGFIYSAPGDGGRTHFPLWKGGCGISPFHTRRRELAY